MSSPHSEYNDGPSNAVVFGVGAAIVLVVLAVLTLPFCIVWSVPPGNVALVSDRGEIASETLKPGGPYWTKPWATVYRVSTQTRRNDEKATVPTKGGLSVTLNAIMQYHVDPDRAVGIYKAIGENFEQTVVDPKFRNAVRDACSEYAPEALYTHEREAVEKNVFNRCVNELGPLGFVVEAVMLQDPVMPDVVKQRVEAKVAAEQDAIRMQSVFLQRELEGKANKRVKELDAEAKVIEAKGIAEAQKIIKQDLSHEYLVYLWVDALKECAKHNNATIYVPTGSDGMPMFKDVRHQAPAAK